ncbi:hypothetical protein [Aestuariivirga sp.]|uniref:hypothetical protein n=1 Tax=Aestuariivirga sp. TaxID=2650926 RepID=UPI0039E70CFD
MTKKMLTIVASGQEGSFQIDALTGMVQNPQDVPEWATGVVTGLLAERARHYDARLGAAGANAHLDNPLVEFSDLGWVGVDNEGDEVSIDANDETRREIVAKLLGLNTDPVHGDIEQANGTTMRSLQLESEEEAIQTATEETIQEATSAQAFAPVAAHG